MAKEHGDLRPEDHLPVDPEGRGNHILQGLGDVTDEIARKAIGQSTLDRGRVVEQRGGDAPGFYLGDGADDWLYLGGFPRVVGSAGIQSLVTLAKIELWVDNVNGDDGNDGSVGLPIKSLVEMEARLPVIINHTVMVRVLPFDASVPNAGAYEWPVFRNRTMRAPIIIRGEGFQQLSTGTAGAGSSQVAVVSSGLTTDELMNASASIHILSGAAIGDKRNISENTTTDIYPSSAFSGVVAEGDSFEIIKPLVRLTLSAQIDGGVLFANGTSFGGGQNNSPVTPALYLVNLKVETPAYPDSDISIRGTPIYTYGVSLVNGSRLRANAGVCAGCEQETNTPPYQKNRTMTQLCPDLSPTLTSLTGWGLTFEGGVASMATAGKGFDGYLIAREFLTVRGSDNDDQGLQTSIVSLRGGRAGNTIVGDLQTFKTGYLAIHAAKSVSHPHIDFKFRATYSYPVVENRDSWLYLGHCDLGTNAPLDGVVSKGQEASTYIYRSYGTVAGIGLRTKQGGRIQVENVPLILGTTGDFSEDDGVTLRAVGDLVDHSYFRDTEKGSLIFRED